MLTVAADDVMRPFWLDQYPFIDPTEWKRMLDRCVANYNRLQKEDPIV